MFHLASVRDSSLNSNQILGVVVGACDLGAGDVESGSSLIRPDSLSIPRPVRDPRTVVSGCPLASHALCLHRIKCWVLSLGGEDGGEGVRLPMSEEQGRGLQRAVSPLLYVSSFETESHCIALAGLELSV